MNSKEKADLKNIHTEEINKLTSENISKENEIKLKNEKLKSEFNQLLSDYDSQIKILKNKVKYHEIIIIILFQK